MQWSITICLCHKYSRNLKDRLCYCNLCNQKALFIATTYLYFNCFIFVTIIITRFMFLIYRSRMHSLLLIEEMAQFDQLSQFNVVCTFYLTKNYLLMSNATGSAAKYARPGELFGKVNLGASLSEDTSAGRLILTNCSIMLLSKPIEENDDKVLINSMQIIWYYICLEEFERNFIPKYICLFSSHLHFTPKYRLLSKIEKQLISFYVSVRKKKSLRRQN